METMENEETVETEDTEETEETLCTVDLKKYDSVTHTDNLKARDASESKIDRPGDDGTLRRV